MHIGWPQGIWIGLAALRIILGAILDGEDKRQSKHKFSIDFVSVMIGFGLLYWGGFFG